MKDGRMGVRVGRKSARIPGLLGEPLKRLEMDKALLPAFSTSYLCRVGWEWVVSRREPLGWSWDHP